ncbi:transporter substrate-binding domain-containing protein [Mesorhizobium sp. M1E.F.Ca.ET.045.02.1.1]|uniref:transporter substrate-binding domain-containing protein n=1 Tax=unclassified Mesorhizobium TaxID=325217 RepID=UPI000F74E7D9|nr:MULTISPECIES: transporter substrate-binding domain-containing protein [unclassified Mesorhizobium]AZO23338.1 transporter substrate-binding domain-containing protein [Mesorhizobium sp. M1E.F.Ca.ET.045.02.1.1]RUW73279.1 transporter substrate-binding domain-containing protein [Mesorhizobium sp. M1E.F.Ca.ET.063.01.1.1]
MRAKIVAAIILAFSAWFALLPARADDSLKHVIDQKTLTVGVAINPPWILKKADGKFAGYDVDLTNALASDLGVELKLVEVPWNDLKTRLLKGDFDLIAAGYANTPERARDVVFSNPTGTADIRMVASVASVGRRPGKALTAPGYKIAVLSNSTDEAAAKEAFPKAEILSFANTTDVFAALIGGDAQAMVATSPTPQMAARLYDAKFKLVGGPLLRTPEAFALRPDDIRLVQYVDNWIGARTADGTIAGIRRYWFGGFKWMSRFDTNAKPDQAKPKQ